MIWLLLMNRLVWLYTAITRGNTEDRISYIFTMYNIISTGEKYDVDAIC